MNTKSILKMKSAWIFIVGIILILFIFEFNNYTRSYYIQNNKIQKSFNKIKNNELLLNYNVLITSLYMYRNNDLLIESIDKLNRSIDALIQNKYFKENYGYVYKEFLDYKKLIDIKVELVYEFQTLNSALKNSTMYLASLLNNLPKLNIYKIKHGVNINKFEKNIKYSQKVIEVVSSIFLAKNSFDEDFIKKLDIGFFEKFTTNDPEIKKFNEVFLAHLKIYKRFFPKLIFTLKNITDNRSLTLLDKIYDNYFYIMNSKLGIIKWVSYALIGFIIAAEIIIFFLLNRLEKEYISLQRVNNELRLTYITDKLTGLYNRNKFDDDVKSLNKPVLVLINIDRFKHINDYYGSKIGDKVLKKVAKVLQTTIPVINANLYRLGADDFGIMYEYENYPNVQTLARKIIEFFEKNEIEIDNIKINISVSIGISTKQPLLENADIALKQIKKSFRKKIMIYEENMNVRDEIKQNIEKSKILYHAIKDGRIEPYFQPIVDTNTTKITKYEVLARLIHPNGVVESIFPYLQIAKDNKLYGDITKIIMKKTYDKVIKKEVDFNINISIEDILDTSIIKQMYHLYLKNKALSKRTTFEILESEAVEDYNEIRKFLERVKYYGASIAIDDFGSGYSNFEHLINLNVDFIKIDGSLIKQLPSNPDAYKIVKVITDFAKEIDIKTVAEFVIDQKTYEMVRKLGINYAQGFYFYEPRSNCMT
ncbi:diguanylate cyclase/phosphodiesterase [Nautilia profundicola AmH]|uniref:Diguanylate cyclase/phosphodiesterase n=1 Tax=Nautilia profundicola (strain ATCC BAA-1463 / DSM 18972 / AmH) TaxID=598659 RepID=B9L7S4_NAUPA|nr:EAL domain-containing protein [Nautilia profundicola]ACM92511.1 diguanylate cyclase/phosphodiesterase [Nautilia profundicola AmH]